MKIVEARIEENRKEDPLSEPDGDPNNWLIEAKFAGRISNWENMMVDLRFTEVKAEIVENGLSGPNSLTLRTRGESPLKKGDLIHVDIREQNER